MSTVTYNLYSPAGDFDEDDLKFKIQAEMNEAIKGKTKKQQNKIVKLFDTREKELIKKRHRDLKKSNAIINKLKKNVVTDRFGDLKRYSKGSFTYNRIPNSKKSNFTLVINNKWDVLAFATVLYGNMNDNDVPTGFKKINRFINNMIQVKGSVPDDFVFGFKNELRRWFPKIKTVLGVKKVSNPKSKRDIKIAGKTFKSIFGKIKLKNVIVKDLHYFNTKPYDVNEYCVISYCEKYLPKKKYKIIKDTLERIKTPTYPELTTMLNNIDFGLDVFVLNGRQIQNQEYNKKIKILIHEQHMYILKKNIFVKYKGKVNSVNSSEYDNLINHDSIEYFTNSECVLMGEKYKVENRFKDINDLYKFNNVFSHTNINFIENCGIRAGRYCDRKVKGLGCMDINSCYINIIKNKKYIFPVQDGTEITEDYNGVILDHGFYFCEFNNINDIEKILYGDKAWIMGYVINDNKLNVNITLQHIAKGYKYGQDNEFDDQTNRDFTGQLIKVFTETYKYYNTTDELESNGLLELIGNNGHLSLHGVSELIDRYKTKCGFYAYLGVISHSKNWLHKLYNAMAKYYGDIKVRRIYTDSILINKRINEADMKEINKITSSLFISEIEKHQGKSNFDTNNLLGDIEKDNMKLNKFRRKDLIELLNKRVSFCLTGCGGYGKSYSIKKKIIPYFKKNDLKYIISSTTKDNARDNEGVTIQSQIFDINLSTNDIINKFSKIDYLIVDECSQMSMKMFCTLQYIKNNTGLKVILIGDISQCRSVESDVSYMGTFPFYKIIDHNLLELRWMSKCRYGKEYDTFLKKVLKAKDSEIKNIVFNYFKDQIITEKTDENDLFLVYTNDKGKEIMNKKGLDKYTTVHKWQGKSINVKHSIYEIIKMFKVRDVLYTALSRTIDPKLISIVV